MDFIIEEASTHNSDSASMLITAAKLITPEQARKHDWKSLGDKTLLILEKYSHFRGLSAYGEDSDDSDDHWGALLEEDDSDDEDVLLWKPSELMENICGLDNIYKMLAIARRLIKRDEIEDCGSKEIWDQFGADYLEILKDKTEALSKTGRFSGLLRKYHYNPSPIRLITKGCMTVKEVDALKYDWSHPNASKIVNLIIENSISLALWGSCDDKDKERIWHAPKLWSEIHDLENTTRMQVIAQFHLSREETEGHDWSHHAFEVYEIIRIFNTHHNRKHDIELAKSFWKAIKGKPLDEIVKVRDGFLASYLSKEAKALLPSQTERAPKRERDTCPSSTDATSQESAHLSLPNPHKVKYI